MSDPNQILEKYIQSILQLQQEHQDRPPSVDQLNQIAAELGLSKEELDFIDKRFQDYLDKGEGFMRYRNWDRAILELEKALHIKPLHLPASYHLADAYFQRGQLKKTKADLEKALIYAEKCLELDARNEKALYLLSLIQKKLRPIQSRYYLSKYVFLGLTAIFLLFSFYLAWEFILKPLPSSPKEIENRPPPQVEDQGIPVQLGRGAQDKGFDLFIEQAQVIKGEQSPATSLLLNGYLVNSTYDVEGLFMQVMLLNQAGRTLKSQDLDLFADYPETLAGDQIPFQIKIPLSNPEKEIKQIKFRLLEHEIYPRDPKATNNRLIPLENGESLPLRFTERYPRVEIEPDAFEQYLNLAYQNVGSKPIYQLRVSLLWYDKFKRLVHSYEKELINTNEPALIPGGIRVFELEQSIPVKYADFAQYKIEILDINF